MRRGAKPAKAKVEAKLPVARKSLKNEGSRVRDLEKRLAESLKREKATGEILQEKNRALTEALEQQTATAEILRVISGSPTDIQPVLNTLVESAGRLCEAYDVTIWRVDGDVLRLAAHHGPIPQGPIGQFSLPLVRGTVAGRSVLDGRTVHVADMQTEADEFPESSEHARRMGFRTILSVPLIREGIAIGVIVLRRTEAELFTERQVALLQTFADQAVIAIENVRLFTELEARNRDLTATSEILRVISSSPTDLQPVFDTIVRSAVRLCDATFGSVALRDGDRLTLPAAHGLEAADLETFVAPFPIRLGPDTVSGRAILEGRVVHVRDQAAEPAYAGNPGQRVGTRSIVAVPMFREGSPIGAITAWRREVRPFTDAQIELLKTFADQAVIAIENVRLFKELEEKNRALTLAHAQVTEALEQQTATSEILRVISSSPTDVEPVFESIVRSAARLCEAADATLSVVEGREYRIGAHYGPIPLRPVGTSFPIGLGTVMGKSILEARAFHVEDLSTAEDFPEGRALALELGQRTTLCVPLLREGATIGTIMLRRTEARLFSDKQVTLLQTFADQAVIAIENVRLFKELEARNKDLTVALEQQTATSEILRVISSSQTDVQPVFDTIVSSAVRLCDGLFSGLYQFDGELLHQAAHHNFTPEALEAMHRVFPARPTRALLTGRAILTRSVVHIPDIELDPEYQHQGLVRAIGFRSALFVPMLREGAPIGVISVSRGEPRPFSDNEIELLKTFADQAVIAIENVRLFKELEARNSALTEALEQQTATAEILRVISSSPTDTGPVFNTILDKATRLCGAQLAVLWIYEGNSMFRLVASRGASPAMLDYLTRTPLHRFGAPFFRAQGPWRAAQVEDVTTTAPYREGQPVWREAADTDGMRTLLMVPLIKEGRLIGSIGAYRREMRRFSDKQVELVKTFADQAVIAIENVRLFKELQTRTGELTQSVEKLTALGEVSQAVSSTLDVETVLNTIVSRASQLAGADGCSIYEYDEAAEQFELRATHNFDAEFVEAIRAAPLRKGEGLMGRAAEMREPVQIPDITRPGAYQSSVRNTLIRFGYRALLSVPLLREDQIIGSLSFNRKAPGEFPPQIIDVLKTFATQSALAIQSARLFRELADKSRQLEVASQHKSEFLANMSHELRTPLNAIIGFSEVLTERMFGELNEKQDEYLKDIHVSGTHLLSLINDILDLSKIEAGRMELELTDFDLPTAIDNALTLVRERAARRGIALHQTVDERLGQVRGDERKIKQVLLNLLSNAIKFTRDGGRIDVRAAPADGMVEVSVTDTGIGIAPEDQEAVFEEFRQVGGAEKKAEGTGLGLALSRKFIELHGGKIWVQSEVGRGSTFTFTIPVRRGE